MNDNFPPIETTTKAGFGGAGLILLLLIGLSIIKK
jgi:hypothetical protein